MREAGKVTSYILNELKNIIKPGISTMDLDRFVEKTVKELQAVTDLPLQIDSSNPDALEAAMRSLIM